MKRHLPLLSLFAHILFATTSPADAATVEYSAGHGDIGLAYEALELELHYHFGNGAVLDGIPLLGEIEYDPDEAHVRVSDDTRAVTTVDLSFLGTTAGDPVWRLPQSNTPGLPFLGIASEELDGLGFSGATIQLTSFSGPGEFALWQSGGLGGFNVIWQTIDGIGPVDILNLGIGVHDHFNYGFTAEGVYDVGLTAEAQFSAGGSGHGYSVSSDLSSAARPRSQSQIASRRCSWPAWLWRRDREFAVREPQLRSAKDRTGNNCRSWARQGSVKPKPWRVQLRKIRQLYSARC